MSQARQAPAIVVLEYDEGARSGFAHGIHASAAPCRFQCIARDPGERLYVVGPVDPVALDALLEAFWGNRYFMPNPAIMNVAQRAALDALLKVSEGAFTAPTASLVFTFHIDTVPNAVCSIAGVESRVSRALQGDVSALSDWSDIRRSSVEVDWLDAMQLRAEAATAGPWRSWIEGRDHWGGCDFIRTAGDDIELTGATHADQDFIAHARQDIPRLIEEIRRLRQMLAARSTP